MTRAQQDSLAAAVLLALALCFVGPGLLPGQVWAPADIPLTEAPLAGGPLGQATPANGLLGDVVYQELPWRLLAQRELRAGRFPLWNAASLHGYPFFANGQSAVLYPLNLLWILLPVEAAAGLIAALKLWLAGLGMYGFLRAGAGSPGPAGPGDPAPALLAGVGWMFCGPLVVWQAWPQTNVLLLLPWLAWAVGRWCATGGRGAWLALAALTGVAIFGGHAETLQNVAIVLAIWAAGLLIGRPLRRALGRGAGLLGAGLLGAGLGAVQLLPFAAALLDSREWAARATAGPPFAATFPPEYLWTWLLPTWFGHPLAHLGWGIFNYNEQTGYVGLAVLLGAGLALVGAARRRVAVRPVAAWGAVLLLALLLAYTPAPGGWLRSLLGLDSSITLRWLAPAAFALLVLAAHGWGSGIGDRGSGIGDRGSGVG